MAFITHSDHLPPSASPILHRTASTGPQDSDSWVKNEHITDMAQIFIKLFPAKQERVKKNLNQLSRSDWLVKRPDIKELFRRSLFQNEDLSKTVANEQNRHVIMSSPEAEEL